MRGGNRLAVETKVEGLKVDVLLACASGASLVYGLAMGWSLSATRSLSSMMRCELKPLRLNDFRKRRRAGARGRKIEAGDGGGVGGPVLAIHAAVFLDGERPA